MSQHLRAQGLAPTTFVQLLPQQLQASRVGAPRLPLPAIEQEVSAGHSSPAAAAAQAAAGAWGSAGAVFVAAALAGASAAVLKSQPRRRGAVQRAAQEKECPELVTEKGVDYTTLRDLLADKDFKAADAETRRLLIELAGPAAVKRGWVYFAEVRTIPEVDMTTVDSLWQHFSNGKFGYAAQRKIWRQCREQFDKFAEKVSWFTDKWKNRNWPDEFIYNVDAPVGHLPLTNCIRGAQVLQELMAHPAFEKKTASAGSTKSTSPVAALALGEKRSKSNEAGSIFVGRSPSLLGASRGSVAWRGGRSQAICRLAAPAPTAAAPAPAAAASKEAATFVVESLESLEECNIINEHGICLPSLPDDTKASAFVLFDAQHKAQYLGFSKDLRNTLRTLLCRRPELAYHYKAVHLMEADNAKLLQIRTAWADELGGLPAGNREQRQKNLWESPVDGGAMSERAYKQVAEQKAKQILQQLKDRGFKESVEWKQDLILQGKVDPVPSALSLTDLEAQQESLSKRTKIIEKEVKGKKVSFEIFYVTEFDTKGKGGYWFDVELSANRQKSSHRIIVGRDLMASLNAGPHEVVENAFAVLLARKLPRQTDGLITSEVFPINYFTATNVAVNFPEFLDLFGQSEESFDWGRAQWNFHQVHDYAQDEKRTIPAGPMGGIFDPVALQ